MISRVSERRSPPRVPGDREPRFYLEALRAAGFEIVLVSNGRGLASAAMARLLPICAHVLWRDNVGYDFGAYRDGLGFLGDLSRFQTVVLANDSVYGPFFDLRQTLAGCDAATPVWGMTDSWSRRYHLQSYFLLLQGEALRHPCVGAFFAGLLPTQSKLWVVRRYEIGFTQAMLRGGLRCRALFPYRDAAAALLDAERDGRLSSQRLDPTLRRFFAQVGGRVKHGKPLNPMHQFWDHLIASMHCPFVKRELLTRNPAEIPHAFVWEKLIRSVSAYDTDLIVRHLQLAVARDRAP
jgi:lipopolysaccharide biosynthesis protein